jgi:hypothetical protein
MFTTTDLAAAFGDGSIVAVCHQILNGVQPRRDPFTERSEKEVARKMLVRIAPAAGETNQESRAATQERAWCSGPEDGRPVDLYRVKSRPEHRPPCCWTRAHVAPAKANRALSARSSRCSRLCLFLRKWCGFWPWAWFVRRLVLPTHAKVAGLAVHRTVDFDAVTTN